MATGRDEMLKRNQQKTKKRKGLMQVLEDYRREEEQAKTYKLKNTPSLGDKAAKAKTNTKTAFSGKSLMPSGNNKTKIAFGGRSLMQTDPVKPIGSGSGGGTRRMPPSEQANKDKEGKPTGTYGAGGPSDKNPKPKPTERSDKPKPKRGDFPAGKTGADRFQRALNAWKASLTVKTKVKRNRRGRVVK